jgi:putative transcriptional regulator
MDWQAFDALTDEEVIARARTDPDNKPLTKADLRRMRRRPRAYIVRRALQMTQEEFAAAYRIPIGTLRGLGAGPHRARPGQSRLKVIAVDPEFVKRALAQRPGGQRGKPVEAG